MKVLISILFLSWLVNMIFYHRWDLIHTRRAHNEKNWSAIWFLTYKIHSFNWLMYVFHDTDQLGKLGKKKWEDKK